MHTPFAHSHSLTYCHWPVISPPEQTQGGVPRVFLDALNEYGDCNEHTTATTTTTGAATTDDGTDEDRPVVHVRSALRADGVTVVCID
jgi:hypothetical protein